MHGNSGPMCRFAIWPITRRSTTCAACLSERWAGRVCWRAGFTKGCWGGSSSDLLYRMEAVGPAASADFDVQDWKRDSHLARSCRADSTPSRNQRQPRGRQRVLIKGLSDESFPGHDEVMDRGHGGPSWVPRRLRADKELDSVGDVSVRGSYCVVRIRGQRQGFGDVGIRYGSAGG